MKLGLLATSFPRDPEDFAGRFVLDFALALGARGHTLHALCPEDPTRPHRALPGIEVRALPYLVPRRFARTFYGRGVPENVRANASAYPGLVTFPAVAAIAARRTLADADALISHWALPSALVLGAVRRDRPHLAVFHSADVHLLAHLPLGRQLARAVEREATALWFVADALAARFEETLGRAPRRPVVVRPMGPERGLPVANREEARAALGLDGTVVLALGRLEAVKGTATLVRAVATLPDVTLVVAGDGSERPGLEALARSIGARVRFVGVVRGERKAACLAAADVFALPSVEVERGRTEGAPVAVVEALASGLPVVATTVGGVPELVGDAGMLVPPGDEGALASALRTLADPRKRARLVPRARVRACAFGWDETAAIAESLLRA